MMNMMGVGDDEKSLIVNYKDDFGDSGWSLVWTLVLPMMTETGIGYTDDNDLVSEGDVLPQKRRKNAIF